MRDSFNGNKRDPGSGALGGIMAGLGGIASSNKNNG